MRKVLKAAALILTAVLVFFGIAVGIFLALRARQQQANAKIFAIESPHGINEGLYVKIGGIDQYIQIRGLDRRNPVILCLHGGPGGTWLPLTELFVPWEREFTVVQWDQRAAGRTLEANGASILATLSVARAVKDGIEVAQFLRGHLSQDKIILLGHSWGSILGVNMVKQHPELFLAYVGTGQVSSMPRSLLLSYGYIQEQARDAHDQQSLKQLQSLGPPPFHSLNEIATFFNLLGKYEVESDQTAQSSRVGHLIYTAPAFSLRDIYYRNKGFAQVPWRVYQEMLFTDLTSLGFDFNVPVYFIQGAEDRVTSTELARQYFDRIQAPQKEMVLLEKAGHFAVWWMPDRFLKELRDHIGRQVGIFPRKIGGHTQPQLFP